MEIKSYMCIAYRNVKLIQISKRSLNAIITKAKHSRYRPGQAQRVPGG